MHTIGYDEIHDELVVMNPWAGAVLTFRGDANGEVAPIRTIQGSKTGLALSDVMVLDAVNNEYYVPAGQSMNQVQVFNRTDVGDVAPKRIIRGMGLPSVDTDHNLLLSGGGGGTRVFERTVEGDAKPIRVITGGPISGTNGPGGAKWIPGTRNFLGSTRPFGIKTYGDRPGAPDNYQTPQEASTYVGVWSIDDSGDAPPRYTIAHDLLKEFRNFAVNPKNREIMISDKSNNAIFTFSFPEAWETLTPINNPPGPTGGGRGGGGGGAQLLLEDLRMAFLRPWTPQPR
jgi:hypothetical protein